MCPPVVPYIVVAPVVTSWAVAGVMITYNIYIYIVIRETGQFSSKGIINDFIGNLTHCFTAIH